MLDKFVIVVLLFALMGGGYSAQCADTMSDEEYTAYFLPTKTPLKELKNGLTINYEGFRRSMVEQCQCQTNPLGGFEREATLYTMLDETSSPRSLVDAGAFLRDKPKGENTEIPPEFLAKADTLMKMYKMAGIEAVNVSFMDFGAGLDFIKNLQKKYDVPFISANLLTSDSKSLLFEPYVIVNKILSNGQQVKVAYLGVTRDSGYDGMPETLLKDREYRALGVIDTIRKYVPELKQKADMVVLLLYARPEAEYALSYLLALKDGEQPDLVICGEFHGMNRDVQNVNKSRVVCCGYEGRQIGNIFVKFDKANKPVKFLNKLIDIKPAIPAVDVYKKLVDAVAPKKPMEEIKKISIE